MLEQIQRDLFALGARLADPAHRIAGRVTQGRRCAPKTSRGSRAGSTRSKPSCRRCAGSSWRRLRRAAPRCTWRARSAVAPSGAMVASRRRRAFETELLHLRQPPVRPAVRDGARREPARRGARNRVVNAPRAWPPSRSTSLRRLRAAGAQPLRELSSRLAPAAARDAAARSPRSTRSRASPTTSPTKATCRRRSGSRCSTTGAAVCTPAPCRRAAQRAVCRDDAVFVALGDTIRRVPAAGHAVRRSAQRVPAGRRPSSATRRGTTCWTTAGDRRTRSAGSCCASPATTIRQLDGASDAVCTALQLTNFWQDLASDWARGRLYVPLDDRDARPALEMRSRRWADDAGVAGRACAHVGADAGAVRRGPPVCDGVERPAALGAARSPGSAARAFSISSSSRLRRLRPPSDARRRRRRSARCGARSSGSTPPELRHWPATPTSTTRSSCCRPRSAARSSPSGTSAAPWTTRSTRRRARRGARCVGARESRAGAASWPRASTAAARRRRRAARCSRSIAQFNLPREAFEALDRRRRDGSRRRPLRDVRRPLRVLHPRRVGGRADLRRDLRLPGSRRRGSTRIDLGVALQLTNILRDVARRSRRGPRLHSARGSARASAARKPTSARKWRRPGSGVRSPAVKALLAQQARAPATTTAAPRACCRAGRAPARRRRRSWARSTAASSTRIERPTTTCSRRSSGCPAAAARADRGGDLGAVPCCCRERALRRRRRRRRLRRAQCGGGAGRARRARPRARSARRSSAAARRRSPIARPASSSTTGSTCSSAATARRSRSCAGSAPKTTSGCSRRSSPVCYDTAGRRSVLRCPPLPSPLHLLAGVLRWDALPLADRLSALRVGGRSWRRRREQQRRGAVEPPSPRQPTVQDWLRSPRAGPDAAGVAVGSAGGRGAEPVAGGRRRGAVRAGARRDVRPDPQRPRRSCCRRGRCTRCTPSRRAAIFERARRVTSGGGRAADRERRGGRGVEVRGERFTADRVIAAVPWFALESLLGSAHRRPSCRRSFDAVAGMAAKPIVTVNLWYDRPVMDDRSSGCPGGDAVGVRQAA